MGNRAKHSPYKNNKRYEGEKRAVGESFQSRHFGGVADSGPQVEFGCWETSRRQVSGAMLHSTFIIYSCVKFTLLSKVEASLSTLQGSGTVGISNRLVLTAIYPV